MTDFLKDLNEAQKAAVEYIDGPELVIAGAGSGKTRVLTYKIAYLLSNGMKPWEIMALTFTNKAAKEMKARIATLVGEETARNLRMGTFHSLFARILRAEAPYIGYNGNYTIYDESDSRSLIKFIIKELALDDKKYRPAEVHNRISAAKNMLMTARDYVADLHVSDRDKRDNMPAMANIYKIYEQRCKASNVMDFDDLLLNTYLLFKDNEEICNAYSSALRYILVDEYQDTNYAQQRILLQLTSQHQYVCVVGDDAQSIYGFRGANIDNILNFQYIYKGAKLFKLEQNYRSTQRIVQAANSLIRKNARQIEKNVFSRNDEGDNLLLKELASDREEAIFVCNDIKAKIRHEGFDYSDFAILYRTNYQSRTFEEQFMKSNIPYSIYGGMSFYQRKEIKDLIAYFRLSVNHNDEEALRRIINYPARGIGNTTVLKIVSAAKEKECGMWQVIEKPEETSLKINNGTLAKLTAFKTLIETFTQFIDTHDAFAAGKEIVKLSGITADIYSSTEPEYISRQENIEEFLSSMQEFVEAARESGEPDRLTDFLHEVALLSDREDEEDNAPKVTLMTIHSAKGLEFPVVYIVGMEENIFPSPMCTDSMRKLEEERRLLYVAITRAEKSCALTYARSRYRYGKMEFDTPSRFLRDIDSRFITGNSYTRFKAANTSVPQQQPIRPSFSNKDSDLQSIETKSGWKPVVSASASVSTKHITNPSYLTVGTLVMHDRFGKGIILSMDGVGESAKATVEFENVGKKQLLLKFAKLRAI